MYLINGCHNVRYITTKKPVKNLVHSYPEKHKLKKLRQ
jgi:hypothetical protein